ncbi:MAG: hypothetical protein R2838_23440 [Caldilineaceae bacterium]
MENLPQDPVFYVKTGGVLGFFLYLALCFLEKSQEVVEVGGCHELADVDYVQDRQALPAEIAQAAQRARFERRVYLSVLTVVAWGVLYLFDAETAINLFQSLVTFARNCERTV